MTCCISCLFSCRVGCMVASMEDINVSVVVCLGYPLKVWCFFYDSMPIFLQDKLISYGFVLLLTWDRSTEEGYQLFVYLRVYYLFINNSTSELIPFVDSSCLFMNLFSFKYAPFFSLMLSISISSLSWWSFPPWSMWYGALNQIIMLLLLWIFSLSFLPGLLYHLHLWYSVFCLSSCWHVTIKTL